MVFPGTDQSGGPIFPSDEQVPDIVTDIDDLLAYFPDNFVNTISAVHSRMGFRSVWYYIDLVNAKVDALEPSAPELNPIVVRLDAAEADITGLRTDVDAHELINDAHRNNLNNPHAVSWPQIGQKPATFPPDAHTHPAGAIPTATGSAAGVVTLEQSTNDTSNESGGKAATPSAVKAAYDLAAGKVTRAGDTMTGQLNVNRGARSAGLRLLSNQATANADHVHIELGSDVAGSGAKIAARRYGNSSQTGLRLYGFDGSNELGLEVTYLGRVRSPHGYYIGSNEDYGFYANTAINQMYVKMLGVNHYIFGGDSFAPSSEHPGNKDLGAGSAALAWRNVNYTGTLNDLSDVREKKNISKVTRRSQLDALKALEPIRFQYRGKLGQRFKTGLAAQEVEAAFAAAGLDSPVVEEEGTKFIALNELVYSLVGAVAELTGEIEELKRGGRRA